MSSVKLIDRVRDTYKYFKTGVAPNKNRRRLNTKKSPFVWVTNIEGQPQWSMVDYKSFYEEGFNTNSVIYAAVTTKVRAISKIDLRVSTGDIDSPDDLAPKDNELARLLLYPNKHQSFNEFQQLQTVYLNLTGNAFTYCYRPNNQSLPTELWPLNPAHVQIVPGNDGLIAGYIYHPQGAISSQSFPIETNNMMHVKFPNPNDPLEGLGFGLSPISPLAKSGDVDNQITHYLKIFFQRGAMPQGALKLKDMMLDEDSIAEIKERFMQVYGGVDNWSDIAVLDMTMEYERIGLTFDEMDFSNIDERNESRILLPFGVPAEILPIRLGLQGSTFSNKEEARKWFWEDTMDYEMNLFLDEYRRVLTPINFDTETGNFEDSNNYFIRWDISKVKPLQDDVKELIGGAYQLFTMGVPPKTAFKMVGLQVEDYEGIENGYLPLGVRQVSGEMPSNEFMPEQTLPEDENDGNEETNTDDDNEKQLKKNSPTSSFTLEQKRLIYKNFDNITKSHEEMFGNATASAFQRDKAKINSIINENKKKALETKATLDMLFVREQIDDYLFNEGRENWRDVFVPVITSVVSDTGEFWADQLGTTFNLRNIQAESWFQDYTLKFADPITRTSSDSVHSLIAQAMEEGWSNDQTANRMNDLFDQWITGGLDPTDYEWLYKPARDPRFGNRTLQWRRELIARTETTRASNAGSKNLFKNWGVEKKEWLATFDNRTRDSHANMQESIVDIDEKFITGLGNGLDYPGDPSAPLADTAQCRCTVLPVLDAAQPPLETQPTPVTEMPFVDFTDNLASDDFKRFSDEWEGIINQMPQDMQEAFTFYTGNNYRPINKHLRNITPTNDEKLLETIKTMDKDFQNSLSQNMVLKRGMDEDILSIWGVANNPQALVGTTIEDLGYMSTGVGKSLGGRVNLEIQAAQGTKGAFIKSISNFEHENEFLLPRKTKLEILEVVERKTPRGVRFVDIVAKVVN